MDFALGMLTGMIIMWAIAQRLMGEWKRDLEKLKDFETWKKWKNQE